MLRILSIAWEETIYFNKIKKNRALMEHCDTLPRNGKEKGDGKMFKTQKLHFGFCQKHNLTCILLF